MKLILKKIVGFFLKLCAKGILFRFRPHIIVIAGSEGKSILREEISEYFLGQNIRVRENSRGFNTEIGLPLAILDEPTGKSDAKKWAEILWRSFQKVLFTKEFPEVLVLEFGVDTKGEMKKLLRIARPDISILYCIRPRGFGDDEYLDTLTNEFALLAKSSFRFLANSEDGHIQESVTPFLSQGKNIPMNAPKEIGKETFLFYQEIQKFLPKKG
jgi:hypothetical protein